jgi:uncharacterized phage protein (TIGR02220 family)
LREYGRIPTTFWIDERILPLDGTAKLVACYLLSGSQTNIIGCMRVTPSHIEADGVCSAATGRDALRKLAACGFIEYDSATHLVRIVGWFDHNPISNESSGKGAVRAFTQCPKSPLLANVMKDLTEFAEKMPEGWIDRCGHRCRHWCVDRCVATETDTDTETETETDRPSGAGSETSSSPVAIPYVEIIDRLNEKAGRRFDAKTATTRDDIKALWKAGRRLKDFFDVIDYKAAEWGGDAKMHKHICPSTLFRKSNFITYLDEARAGTTPLVARSPLQEKPIPSYIPESAEVKEARMKQVALEEAERRAKRGTNA